MSLEYSTLDELSTLISDTVIGHMIIRILELYGSFGPVPGILLPFIEAFLPFLPIIVFILANSIVYGLFFGFIFSWIGAVLGATLLFIVLRKMEQFEWIQKIKAQKQVRKITAFFDRRGFGPLFLLLCFPFSPSALINVVAAFSRISIQQFVLALILGKAVMIFSVSYVGSSITSFATNPTKAIIIGICIVIVWAIGKFIEARMNSKANQFDSENKDNE
ncbi:MULTISPECIES: TVP38/TMEM64 family protein [Allobacillus]|uniref:TVP38/TMEM64 family membrane protein n=1 Tax=Allobacillus salarius TaxID=1955272 RepID=A0A556P6T6_9BACI|nr:TVP38/TMEM64 family protein [Allobacillus salarius]TSJ60101.1 TVP38/TMEM64 family protein [Allobacillus salarius]